MPWAYQPRLETRLDETNACGCCAAALRHRCAGRGVRREAGQADRRGRAAQSLIADARLVPQRRSRRALPGAGRGRLRQARASTCTCRSRPIPATPLQLLAAGKVDVAISYEPELMLARDKGEPLVAIAAIVQRPLTSIVSLGVQAHHQPVAAARQDASATPGSPTSTPTCRRSSSRPGCRVSSVKEVNVGSNLVPGDALGPRRRDPRCLLELRGDPAAPDGQARRT